MPKTRLGSRVGLAAVVVPAVLVALVSARSFAGSSNDGSRLATVECLVDHGTLAIDRSVFVEVPAVEPGQPAPYPTGHPLLPAEGTCDKARINGHFYSDKPPVPALFLAGFYKVLQRGFGLRAADEVDRFCYLLTLASSGLAYVLALAGTYRMAGALGLSVPLRVLLAASLGLATTALPYARHVNGHILVLALACWIFALGLEPRAAEGFRPLLLGTLAGLAYACEQATGGLLLGLTLAFLVSARPTALLPAALGAMPWVLGHHALVYSFAGVLRPVGTFPEFFDYEGTAFAGEALTGRWNHAGVIDACVYAYGLLFGEVGFVAFNLPLFLALPAGAVMLGRELIPPGRLPAPERRLLFVAGAWAVGTWLVYAMLSDNYAGVCCSVRWFVPLLAAGYLMLGLLLRDFPTYRIDFCILTAWGIALGVLMWYGGPWAREVPFGPALLSAALANWALCRLALWARSLLTPRRP